MEFSSRIRDFIFSWDIHNFIQDENIDEKLETVLDVALDNNIKGLPLKQDYIDNYKDEDCKSELLFDIANHLKETGQHLAVIETPIPKNITKENGNFKSWTSYSFGMCRITVVVIKGFEFIQKEIEEIENEILEEVYRKENKEG